VRKKFLLIFALSLVGCDSAQEEAPVEIKTTEEAKPEEQKSEVEQKRQTAEEAMGEIAPSDRRAFQAALTCEIKRNEGKTIDITAEYIRGLYAKLKSDPAIAEC